MDTFCRKTSMGKRRFQIGNVLTVALLIGCGPKPEQTTRVPHPPPVQTKPATPSSRQDTEQESVKLVEEVGRQIRALLEEKDSPLPEGTVLKTVQYDATARIITLNFSKEFNQLIDSGESVESEAQKALQKTLARISGIEKMRVRVEDKPFESQATDWETPFSVNRSTAANREGNP
jgi:hypothetical protein